MKLIAHVSCFWVSFIKTIEGRVEIHNYRSEVNKMTDVSSIILSVLKRRVV